MNRDDDDLQSPAHLDPPRQKPKDTSIVEWMVVLVLVLGLVLTFTGALLGLAGVSVYLGPALIGVVVIPYAVYKLIDALTAGFGLRRPEDVLDLDEHPRSNWRQWAGKPKIDVLDLLVPAGVFAVPIALYAFIMLL